MPSLNNKTFLLATLNLSIASSHEILSSLARSNVTLSEASFFLANTQDSKTSVT